MLFLLPFQKKMKTVQSKNSAQSLINPSIFPFVIDEHISYQSYRTYVDRPHTPFTHTHRGNLGGFIQHKRMFLD